MAIILGACQPTPTSQQSPAAGATHKHTHAIRYAIDPTQSSITLRVYREGPLARFGHNHVIVASQIQGIVYREADILQSDVELNFPAAGMIVDSPDDRAKAGADFPGVLPAEAIAGTRQHMLGPQLLAAEQFPTIAVHTIDVSGQWPELQLTVEVNLRTLSSRLSIPVHLSETQNAIIADSTLRLSQVQLGLQPYSVLGGGLRVADNIDAQIHIVAQRDYSVK